MEPLLIQYELKKRGIRQYEIARDMGFTGVASGPLVRSSYRAGEQLEKTKRS